MGETVYNILLWLSPVIVSGFPLLILMLCAGLLIFAPVFTVTDRGSLLRLRLTGLFCALVWVFYYAEIWSPHRIPVFDYGAPVIALLALVVLPFMAILLWRKRPALTVGQRPRLLFFLANFLIVFSLSPGIFLVFFYAAALQSNR